MQNPLDNQIYHERVHPRTPDLRGDYFRDQTAIIHATPFRRLKHKTQVFYAPQSDHICTRIEHVLHVSTIATTICKGLELDVELAQAIALGHDLGHAPFGHVGEVKLNTLARDIGGFIHEVHSLRVVDHITHKGQGLNLTYAVRDGIVSHCGEDFKQFIEPASIKKNLKDIRTRQSAPVTYEGCVVRVSDIIAYLGRDIEDAIMAGLITAKDVPARIKKNLGNTNGEIIDTLVMDVVKSSQGKESVQFSDNRFELLRQLKTFNYKNIYNHPVLKENEKTIGKLISTLYIHLSVFFKEHKFDFSAYKYSQYIVDQHFGQFLTKRHSLYKAETVQEKCVIDFIAGMSDVYAMQSAKEILLPKEIEIKKPDILEEGK